MTRDQWCRANKIQNEITKIQRELKIWNEDITLKGGLAYCQQWNNKHATALNTNIPEELFKEFRGQVMEYLSKRLTELADEMDHL